MNATKYTGNAPALDTLKDTDIYRLCEAVWRGQRPSRNDADYIRRHIYHGTTGILLRGWLFDFSPLLNAHRGAQINLFQQQ